MVFYALTASVVPRRRRWNPSLTGDGFNPPEGPALTSAGTQREALEPEPECKERTCYSCYSRSLLLHCTTISCKHLETFS